MVRGTGGVTRVPSWLSRVSSLCSNAGIVVHKCSNVNNVSGFFCLKCSIVGVVMRRCSNVSDVSGISGVFEKGESHW